MKKVDAYQDKAGRIHASAVDAINADFAHSIEEFVRCALPTELEERVNSAEGVRNLVRERIVRGLKLHRRDIRAAIDAFDADMAALGGEDALLP